MNEQIKSTIEVQAKPTLTWVVMLTGLIISGLIALNIWQYEDRTNLKIIATEALKDVEIAEAKTAVFLSTQKLIIDGYWIRQENKQRRETGESLLKANGVIMDTLENLEGK